MNTIKAVLLALVVTVALAVPAAALAGHHHRHPHRHGNGGVGVGDNKAVGGASSSAATATASGGNGYMKRIASRALHRYEGGHWNYADYKSLDFKRRIGSRYRYEYFWATDCCSGWGYVTVWPSPYEYGYYYWSVTPGHYHGGRGD
jgi:hypothetical protein